MTSLFLLSLFVLGTAAVAMGLRNLIHSALLLVAAWAGIAGFYLWAGAEFVAFAQALVYVGAISMVVLFAVVLTRPTARTETSQAGVRRAILAFVAAGSVAGLLLGAIAGTPLATREPPAAAIGVHDIGTALMGPHAAALLVLGVVLTVALLGAVVIAAAGRDREDSP